jgi:hypothetical protein
LAFLKPNVEGREVARHAAEGDEPARLLGLNRERAAAERQEVAPDRRKAPASGSERNHRTVSACLHLQF